ncbi:Hypothetical predicted protein [Paramuricea clavata]|uniref:Uncharacterized protein n=1 Tax=Paramuricea clavata TaxID=317549 RepID=A0A7D9DI85_PARCT|nr:Hypothetical predicted protein [Paramuricea clavata]
MFKENIIQLLAVLHEIAPSRVGSLPEYFMAGNPRYTITLNMALREHFGQRIKFLQNGLRRSLLDSRYSSFRSSPHPSDMTARKTFGRARIRFSIKINFQRQTCSSLHSSYRLSGHIFYYTSACDLLLRYKASHQTFPNRSIPRYDFPLYHAKDSPVAHSFRHRKLDHGFTCSLTNGIQYWTVPHTGTYEIKTVGAAGEYDTHGSAARGRGAYMRGEFELNKGDVLKILVGQEGGINSASHSSGGGGGTFVATSSNTPVIIAGGGGGIESLQARLTRCDANTDNSVTSGNSWGGGAKMKRGRRILENIASDVKHVLREDGGTGGGGFYSNGRSSKHFGGAYGDGGEGGRGFVQGGAGGRARLYNVVGGFGGGGGAYGAGGGAGGGGGYSGGASGDTNQGSCGGGGGSFNTKLKLEDCDTVSEAICNSKTCCSVSCGARWQDVHIAAKSAIKTRPSPTIHTVCRRVMHLVSKFSDSWPITALFTSIVT